MVLCLNPPAAGLMGLLAMPLGFAQKLHEFSIDVEVTSGALARPTVRYGSPLDMEFDKVGDAYHAQARKKDCSLSGELQIDVPLPLQMARAEAPETDGSAAAPNPWYFCVFDFAPNLEQRRLGPPKAVTILWDASGQCGLADHAKELDVLRRFFATIPDRIVEVELVLFRNTPQRPLRFQVNNGDVTALLAELNRVAYDGAAGLEKISPGPKLPDLYLLFSEGHLTFGSPQAQDLKKPMYIFSGGPSPDEDVLGRLAAQSGGSYFNLAKGDAGRAAATIGKLPLRVMQTSGWIEGSYPRRWQPVAPPILLLGSSSAYDAFVKFEYSDGLAVRENAEQHLRVERPETIHSSGLLKRAWARNKLADLLASQPRDSLAIEDLGKQYSLVTPYTSLMVLENVNQYVQYQIVPPATLPDMVIEYKKRAGESKDTLDTLAGILDARAQWNSQTRGTTGAYRNVYDIRDLNISPPNFRPRIDLSSAPRSDQSTAPRSGGSLFSSGAQSASEFSQNVFGGRAVNVFGDSSFLDELPGGLPLPSCFEGSGQSRELPGDLPLPERSKSPAGPSKGDRSTDVSQPQANRDSGAVVAGTVDTADSQIAACLSELKQSPENTWMGIYLARRGRLAASPDFYLQCGDFMLRRHHKADAIRVLSNLADQSGDDVVSLRQLARYLAQMEMWDQAVALLEEVYVRSPRDPVSVRELAMALVARADQRRAMGPVRVANFCGVPNDLMKKDGIAGAQPSGAVTATVDPYLFAEKRDYQRAIDLLYRFVQTPSPAPDAQRLILLTDLANAIAKDATLYAGAPGDDAAAVDSRLKRRIEMDLRVVLTCEAGAGVALSVLEPSGEAARAGLASNAVGTATGMGMGMQEYVLHRVIGGMYKVQAQCDNVPQGRRRVVHVDVTTDFGRPNEKHTRYTVVLPQRRGAHTIADLFF